MDIFALQARRWRKYCGELNPLFEQFAKERNAQIGPDPNNWAIREIHVAVSDLVKYIIYIILNTHGKKVSLVIIGDAVLNHSRGQFIITTTDQVVLIDEKLSAPYQESLGAAGQWTSNQDRVEKVLMRIDKHIANAAKVLAAGTYILD